MTEERVTLVRYLIKQGAWAFVAVALMGGAAYAGKVMLDRGLKHFDRVESVMEKHEQAMSATARAIRRMTEDNTAGREAAVKQLSAEVSKCCRRGR